MAKSRPPDASAADGDEDTGRGVSGDESALFRRVMADVKPIAKPAPPPNRQPRPARGAVGPAAKAKPGTRAWPMPAVAPEPPPPPPEPELTHGEAPGLDKRTRLRLKRGNVEIQGRIDLHGLSQTEAHRALVAFLEASQRASRRTVLVITGKGTREGTGVIRAAVPRWLNEPALRRMVLAFSHAQPKDGGEGALYVLLRRLR